jgi:hypothetical protein
MLALMASGREVANADLRRWLGRDGIKKPVRELLNREQLVVSRAAGRTHRHELTTAGWQWCVKELTVDPPRRSGSMGGALYAVLHGLASYLDRVGASLAEVFIDESNGIENTIRQRYWELAAYANDWVPIAALRPALTEFDRHDVDRTLVDMNRLPDVNLAPEPIQGTLTDQDRQAAVEVGGKANHLLAISADE